MFFYKLKNLREDRDTAINKIQAETAQDMQKVRSLQRENAQMHLQVRKCFQNFFVLKISFATNSV